MRQNSISELDKLFLEVGTYRKSEEFKKLIEFAKKFPQIAPYNAMLIHIQKPGSRYVASASEWLRRFNRRINPGARPLVILRPFGPVAYVFELLDTYGDDPFPEKLLDPFNPEGIISEKTFKNLTNNLKCDGIFYSEADRGSSSAGFIQICDRIKSMEIIKKKKKIRIKVLYDMVVNRSHSLETRFATILHELGHIYCGHLGTLNPKWWEDRRFLDKYKREFEAESVCWLVCERMGIKNPSAEYLSGYLNNNEEIPNISIDSVLKAVTIIESMIKNTKDVRKDIIIDTYNL